MAFNALLKITLGRPENKGAFGMSLLTADGAITSGKPDPDVNQLE